jgi:hypothetical protein
VQYVSARLAVSVVPIGLCVWCLEQESLAVDGPHYQCQKKSSNVYPRSDICRVHQQNSPFGDQHAREIEDNLTDLDDYSDNDSYTPRIQRIRTDTQGT